MLSNLMLTEQVVVLTVTAAGQVMVGGTFSKTFTLKEQVAIFPEGSLAVYLTVVVPTLKVLVPTKFCPFTGDEKTDAPESL